MGWFLSLRGRLDVCQVFLWSLIKERGVKNFRVLNKQELTDVLKNIGDQKAVDAIVAGAVARWKSGWGKGKNKTKTKE